MIQEDMSGGYYSTHVAVDIGDDRYDYSIGIQPSGDIRIMTSAEPHMMHLPAAVVDAIIQLRVHAANVRASHVDSA